MEPNIKRISLTELKECNPSEYKRIVSEMRKAKHKPLLQSVKSTIGRNQLCPCGSNKKFKKCCLTKLTPRRENE